MVKRELRSVLLAGAWPACSFVPAALRAQPCGTPGRDGSGNLTGIVNTYYPGTATASVGATSISVGSPSGAAAAIAAGDLLLVIQMQDADVNSTDSSAYGAGTTSGSGSTNVHNTGVYEYVTATGPVAGGAVGMPFGEPGAYWLLLGPPSGTELRRTSYDLTRAAERIRATEYPQARDFAQRNVLQPPSEEESLAAFSRVELR